MQITYHGGPTVKIREESALVSEGEVALLINPYGAVKGLQKLRKQQAHIVLASTVDPAYYSAQAHDEKAFIVTKPGEYEVKGMLISAQAVPAGKRLLVFRVEVGNVSVGYLGGVAAAGNGEAFGIIEGVDVLVLPVGGKGVLTPHQAIDAVTRFDPRIVIPIQFKSARYPLDGETVNVFAKAFGAHVSEPVAKARISRKDLPAAERKLIILE